MDSSGISIIIIMIASSAMEVCNGILMSMSQLLSSLQSELPMGDIHYMVSIQLLWTQ